MGVCFVFSRPSTPPPLPIVCIFLVHPSQTKPCHSLLSLKDTTQEHCAWRLWTPLLPTTIDVILIKPTVPEITIKRIQARKRNGNLSDNKASFMPIPFPPNTQSKQSVCLQLHQHTIPPSSGCPLGVRRVGWGLFRQKWGPYRVVSSASKALPMGP